ncbi:MAG: tetratricopeptide repeat protein [Rikenellaceae bacterium]|nr:tetratricopeptide repeat protein [Rikenellaceae bacterium]
MKKVILALLIAVMAAPAAMSQMTAIKVDKDAILKKIERSNEDIENPKKNTKANAWLDRGKVFNDAATASWSGLYFPSMTTLELQTFYGSKVEPEEKVVNGQSYIAYEYPNFIAYFDETEIGQVLVFWEPKLVVIDNAYEQSFDAYKKAYEVDPKSASKVKAGLEMLANDHKKEGQNAFALQDYGTTADHFAKAYEIQMHPAVAELDTSAVYNAGMFYTFAGDFDKGAKYLEIAENNDYEMDGDVYYFLYHNYYGLGDSNKAKAILQKGISKHPGNTKIVEGLVGIYSVTESDPGEIIDIVKKSIDDEPENPLLWSGLGSIYQKMEDNDNAISAYRKAAELAPGDFYNNFRLAYAHIEIGDDMNKKLNEMTSLSTNEYNDALEKVYQEYEKALPPLEKAYEIDPTSEATVELLKNLTFRLRDRSDDIQQKYDKYNEIFKNMQ